MIHNTYIFHCIDRFVEGKKTICHVPVYVQYTSLNTQT